MTIYKNPYVSRECYFIKTGTASSCKIEASKSSGYIVEFTQGKWEVRKGSFYDSLFQATDGTYLRNTNVDNFPNTHNFKTIKRAMVVCTEEAEPVVTAQWEEVSPKHTSGMRCSACKAKIKYSEVRRFKRCYNCGAVMTNIKIGE